jgi:hypothetical protein
MTPLGRIDLGSKAYLLRAPMTPFLDGALAFMRVAAALLWGFRSFEVS